MKKAFSFLFSISICLILMANSCGMKRNVVGYMPIALRKATVQDVFPGIHSNLRAVKNVDMTLELLDDTEIKLLYICIDSVKIEIESVQINGKFQQGSAIPPLKGIYTVHASRNSYQEAPKNMHEEVKYELSGLHLEKEIMLMFEFRNEQHQFSIEPLKLETQIHP